MERLIHHRDSATEKLRNSFGLLCDSVLEKALRKLL